MTSRQARDQWLYDHGWNAGSEEHEGGRRYTYVAPDGFQTASQFEAVVHETERQAAAFEVAA